MPLRFRSGHTWTRGVRPMFHQTAWSPINTSTDGTAEETTAGSATNTYHEISNITFAADAK
jgi:hypothetical protein